MASAYLDQIPDGVLANFYKTGKQEVIYETSLSSGRKVVVNFGACPFQQLPTQPGETQYKVLIPSFHCGVCAKSFKARNDTLAWSELSSQDTVTKEQHFERLYVQIYLKILQPHFQHKCNK